MTTTQASAIPSQHAEVYLTTRRVAHLATVDEQGQPYVVPVCYVYTGERIYIALDSKPKSVTPIRLGRVRNISANPQVSLLVDTYSEDWQRLGYLLVQGVAHLEDLGTALHTEAVELLREKYAQYRAMPIESQPVIKITPTHFSEWNGRETAPGEAQPERSHLPFAALAQGRHVVRRFKPDEVPRALVEQTLETARWAPSPHGTQPWRFVVLTKPERKLRLADAMSAEWQRNLEMDGESADVVRKRLQNSRSRILNTPVLVIPCLYLSDLHSYPDPMRKEAEVTMAVQSLGAAVQNMLLSAYSLGLDTGWMCAPLFCPDVVCESLDMPDGFTPHALIQMGYGAADPPRREHRGLGELVVWDD